MNSTLAVVLVHSNELERSQLRSALEALPGVQIAGERSDLRSGLAMAHQVRPAILVLELAPPIEDVLNAASHYHMDHPDVAIFLATEVFDPEMLLRALRAGAQEVLRRPLDRGALSAAVERVAALNARKQGGDISRKVFTVFSNKGGLGVSTIASNLAVSLRRSTGSEVVLADFDHQSGDAAFMLGLAPIRSLGDVLAATHVDSASVQHALLKHESGVFVLSQPEQLDRADGMTGHQVGNVLEILSRTFDIVVVDAPHQFNDAVLEVFDRSSTILLLAELSMPSVRAARRSLEIFQRLNYTVVPDRVRLVLNRYTSQSAITAKQIEDALGMPVFATVSNDYASASKAVNIGRPLCLDAPDSRAARDLAALARKLEPADQVEGKFETAPARRPAPLRLFGKRKAS